MKKTYIKPQLWVMATATNELLQYTSWCVYSTNGGEPGKDDRGKIIYDDENFKEEGEKNPWNSDNW